MRKVIFTVLAILLLVASTAHAKGIFIVPENMPDWVIDSMDTKGYWFTEKYAYGIGIAPAMKDHAAQEAAAKHRARVALLTGLGIKTVINTIKIRAVWEHPDTHEIYALAGMPINVVPAEK